MQSNTFLQIPAFVVSELHLSGIDRDVFSYIFYKTQDGLPARLRITWMAEWGPYSIRGVKYSLRRLEEKELIKVTRRTGQPALYFPNITMAKKALADGHAKLPDIDNRKPKSDRTDEDYINGKKREVRNAPEIPAPAMESEAHRKALAEYEKLFNSGADWTYHADQDSGTGRNQLPEKAKKEAGNNV